LIAVAVVACPLAGVSAAEPFDDAFSVVAVLAHDQALAAAHDVELSGPLAFVPGKGGSIAIINITDPTKPRLVWFQHEPEGLFEAETVLVEGPRLYLGTNDFLSIDVTDPAKPVIDAKLSDRPRISRINGMVKLGNHILAANKDGWIDAFDVSRPAAPRLFGALNVRTQFDLSSPHDIDRYGDYAVLADAHGFGRTGEHGKLAVLRVADATTHQLLSVSDWTLSGVVASKQLTGANRVKVVGKFAYAGGSTPSGDSHFVAVDLGDPARPRQAASLAFSDLRGPNGLAVAGKVVFLAGGQTVEAIDISDPPRPRKLAAQKFPDALPTNRDNAHDLVYRDGYLYVTGQNDNRFVVLRVRDDAIRRLAEGS
jgi:hypothetical protein